MSECGCNCHQAVCQSCAMPLQNEKLCGTNADGSKSCEYCKFCYQEGEFTDPELTLEQMIQKLVSFHDKMHLTKEQAFQVAQAVLPKLKRWK